MARYRISYAATDDIDSILRWSETHFGRRIRQRYEALIVAGIRDVARDPYGPGVQSRSELGDGVYSWHLRQSRTHVAGDLIHDPRHFLIYRVDDGIVVIGRVLHDSMDLERHVDPDSTWESSVDHPARSHTVHR